MSSVRKHRRSFQVVLRQRKRFAKVAGLKVGFYGSPSMDRRWVRWVMALGHAGRRHLTKDWADRAKPQGRRRLGPIKWRRRR